MAVEEAISTLGTKLGEQATPTLGTAADIWVIIALIIPGFITFKIIAWLAVFDTKFDQFTTTIYSLMCSFVVFLPVYLIFKLQTLENIRQNIAYPEFIFSLFGFAVLFGFVPGAFIKWAFRYKYTSQGPWDRFARNLRGKYVTVFATDGKIYEGFIKRMSSGDGKKEISLGDPIQLMFDDQGKPNPVPLGEELLFSESSVQKILRR
jgi:uncharacterized membrane protein (GlpM family)